MDREAVKSVLRGQKIDTASAVAAVPMLTSHAAYICSGTWSLIGVELDQPVLTKQSRIANFTNERGVDGRIRYLRNVMGMWLVNECVNAWERSGPRIDLDQLIAAAEKADRWAGEPAWPTASSRTFGAVSRLPFRPSSTAHTSLGFALITRRRGRPAHT